MRPEARLQLDVCQFLDKEYPKVIYMSDLSSGMVLSIPNAIAARKLMSDRGLPDLYIFKPSNEVHGLFLELKVDGTPLKRTKDALKVLKGETKLRKAGDWWDDHIEEQAHMLKNLWDLSYQAVFAVGLHRAKTIIHEYMDND